MKTCCALVSALISATISINYLLKNSVPHYTPYIKENIEEPSSCDDFIYGCCEIYTSCSFDNENEISVHTDIIDWNLLVQKTSNGRDCPRIREIIVEYNTYQFKDITTKDIFQEVSDCNSFSDYSIDCCSYDYNCDTRYFYDHTFFNTDMNSTEYREYFNNTRGEAIIYNKPFSHHWSMGTCPSFQEVFNVYQTSLKNKMFDIGIYFTIIFLIIDLVAIFIIIICMCIKFLKGLKIQDPEKQALTGIEDSEKQTLKSSV